MDQRGHVGYTANERQNLGALFPRPVHFPSCWVVFKDPESEEYQIKHRIVKTAKR